VSRVDAPSVLRGEIAEQPQAVARLLERERERTKVFARALARRNVRFVLIAARGTSDNAARYAQYAFGVTNRLAVALAAPSLTTLYHRPPRVAGALVIGISQSGRSPDVVETIAAARRAGAPTLAIVNDPASPLACAASEVLPLHAGREISIAATKTYTAQLAAVALLARSLAGRSAALDELERVPGWIENVLRREEEAMLAAVALKEAVRTVVLARGINYPTAHEIALKLKELALLFAEAYSTADFRHGPIAMVDEGLPVLFIAPRGSRAAPEVSALARKLRDRSHRLIFIGPGRADAMSTPAMPELLSPLVTVVPGQLLAFHAARLRGLDPDRPRGIRKITETF
jgi:glucosamine--fructose-6-phosphate aminotransferase (isomerizing)